MVTGMHRTVLHITHFGVFLYLQDGPVFFANYRKFLRITQVIIRRTVLCSVVTIASEPASIDYDRSFEKNRDVDVDSMS